MRKMNQFSQFKWTSTKVIAIENKSNLHLVYLPFTSGPFISLELPNKAQNNINIVKSLKTCFTVLKNISYHLSRIYKAYCNFWILCKYWDNFNNEDNNNFSNNNNIFNNNTEVVLVWNLMSTINTIKWKITECKWKSKDLQWQVNENMKKSKKLYKKERLHEDNEFFLTYAIVSSHNCKKLWKRKEKTYLLRFMANIFSSSERIITKS